MSEIETIEAEVAEVVTTALQHYDAPPPTNLFRTEDPTEIVSKATAIADALSEVLRKKELTTKIGKGEHVRVEGWTLLGTMLGVFPVCEWTRPVQDGWEARVVATTMAGAVVGAAEAECLRSERRWKDADDYAIRSMAQTRATSKALRQPLGFVISLAGFEATPAEEMTFAEKRVEPEVKLPKNWKELEKEVTRYGPSAWMDFAAHGVEARDTLFPDKKEGELEPDEKRTLWEAALLAYQRLSEKFDPEYLPGPTSKDIAAAWSSVLGEKQS